MNAHDHFAIRCECGYLFADCGCPGGTAATSTVRPCRCGSAETKGSSQRDECAACPVQFRNLFHVAAGVLERGPGPIGHGVLLDLKDAVEAARPLVDDHIAHPRRPRIA